MNVEREPLLGTTIVSPKEISQRAAQALQVQGVPYEVTTAAARLVEDTELLLGTGLRSLLDEVHSGVFLEPRSPRVERGATLRLEGEWPTLLSFGETLAPALVEYGASGPTLLGPVRSLAWVDALLLRLVRAGLSGTIRWNPAGADESTLPRGETIAWFDAGSGAWGLRRGSAHGEGTLLVTTVEEQPRLFAETGTLETIAAARSRAQAKGLRVDEGSWDEVVGIAAQVLIPTSTRSRLGAG